MKIKKDFNTEIIDNYKDIIEDDNKNVKTINEKFKKDLDNLFIVFKHGFLYPFIYIILMILSFYIMNKSSLILSYLSIFFLNVLLIHNIISFPFEYKLFSKAKNVLLHKHLFFIIFSIFAYTYIYYKTGNFIINGEIRDISFLESLYFSISMWVDLGYSYILPSKEIALMSSIEAINGYFYFAFVLSVLGISINDKIKKLK